METIVLSNHLFSPIVGRPSFPGYTLTCIVKGTFDLKPVSKAQPAQKPLFPTGDEHYPDDEDLTGSLRYENDFAYIKPKTDLLLTGHCYTPEGKPLQACPATFKVGNHSSTLAVFGNRYWKGIPGFETISDPEQFTKKELRYENSFGGAGFDKNPVGKGFTKIKDVSGKEVRPLPNIEYPDNLIDSMSKQPDPAGFGPLGRMWKPRLSKTGTYDNDWKNKRWPWFPEDIDWGYFNAAPPHMQVDGYLQGDEKLFFENLHPVHSRYESQLPGIRARCFVTKKPDDKEGESLFTEVKMNLDTLWVDMDAEKIVLVWRGVIEVKDEEYEEIEHVFIMDEPLEQQPASLERCYEHFLEEVQKREKEWEMQPELPPGEKIPVKEPTVFTVAGLAGVGALTETTAITAEENKQTETSGESESVPKEQDLEEEPEESSEAKPDPEELKANAKAMMAQIGLDFDALPPEVKKQAEEQIDKIIGKITEKDPEKLMETERQEIEAQLDKSLAEAGIDRNNLPQLSPKAQAEQTRFIKELGMDPSMIGESEELQQFWGIFGALLPKMGLDPENLDPLILETKKQMGKIVNQPEDEANDA